MARTIDFNGIEVVLDLDFGHIDNDGNIVKEYSDEADGEVYRSMESFEGKEGICYVNIFDEKYTYSDFLAATGGNEEIAYDCFEMMICTWNCPESYVEDGIDEGYFVECNCGYVYDHNNSDKCPKCGSHEIMK
jgi:hypothetical protein